MSFERPGLKTEKLDLGEFFKKKMEEFSPELKMQAERLRRCGFDLGDDCRVKMGSFLGAIAPKELAADMMAVKNAKAGHTRELASDQVKAANKEIGDALEVAKTAGVNSHWFGGRFIAIRSSEFDDYCGNKVDNLIFDTITLEPLAAMDVTTDRASKARDLKTQLAITKKIGEGADVKYGYALEKIKEAPGYRAVRKTNQKLPYFLIELNVATLEVVMRDLVSGVDTPALLDASNELLMDLRKQAKACQELVVTKNKGLAAAYGRLLRIFESI
ncbi:MAG: hypothetical protein Q8L24_00190 [bacterium]|nr:hypothetical protein [bacterium]